MAKEEQDVEVVEEEKVPAEPEQPKPQDEKKYTDAEVDAIINSKFAKWQAEQEAKANEAEKLRKMKADERAEYEAKKKDDYIAELEAKINRSGLEKEASKTLAESGIAATDEVLNFVVRTTAEETLEAVKVFTELVDTIANTKVKEALKGRTPKRKEHANSGEITKEQFNRMGYKDRNELLQRNPELYKQLKG